MIRAVLLILILILGLLAALVSAAAGANPSIEPPVRSHRIYAHTLATQHAHLLSRLRSFTSTFPVSSHHPHSMSTGSGEGAKPADSTTHSLYPDSYSVKVHALGKVFDVRLRKNEDFLSTSYQHVSLDFGGRSESASASASPSTPISQHEQEQNGFKQPVATHVRRGLPSSQNCYYHGHVVGDPNSVVALSTCYGLSGHITAHGEALGITPDPFDGSAKQSKTNSALRHMHRLSSTNNEQHEKISHSHIVYRLADYAPVKSVCGNTIAEAMRQSSSVSIDPAMLRSDSEAGIASTVGSTQTSTASAERGSALNQAGASTPLTPGSTLPSMRFVELLIVNDWSRYQKLGEATEADTLSLVNLISSYYKSTSFKYQYRIVLVGQVSFQNGDPYLIPYTSGSRPNRPTTPSNPIPTTPSTPVSPPPPSSTKPPANTDNTNQKQPDFSNLPADMQHLIPDILNNMEKHPPTNTPYIQPYNPYYPFPQVNPFRGSKTKAAASANHDSAAAEQASSSQIKEDSTNPQSPSMQSQESSQASTSAAVETQGASGLLTVFNDWQSQQKNLPKRDTTQLFSSLSFASGILGLANVGMTCQDQYSGSVCEINEPSAVQNAIIAAHETGHTLGMSHDSMGNECPQSGYIMAAVAGTGHTFSSCSINYCNEWTDSYRPSPTCVENVPSVWENENSELANISTANDTNNSQDNISKIHDTTPTTVESVISSTSSIQLPSHEDQEFEKVRADSTIAASSTSTTSSSHQLPAYVSYMLVAACCFAMGVIVAYAVQQLRSQTSAAPSYGHLKSSPSPVATSPELQTFALHIAPSQPSTPIATTHVKPHPTPPPTPAHSPSAPSQSPSPSPSPPQDHHFTRAKRRTSLSHGRSSDAAVNVATELGNITDARHDSSAQ